MKRIALILVFAMLAAITAAAQEKPKTDAQGKPETPKADQPKADAKAAALPTVDAILDNYVKAVGGKEAIEKIKTRSMKGSFDLEAFGVSGAQVEMFAKAPNKSSMKIDVTGFGVVNRVFDGATGWASDPMAGLRELSGLELAQMKRGSDFYQELNFKKHYTKLEVKGKEKVGSSEAYVIEATPSEGGPEKLYFDVNTNLLVRHDAEVESPQGKLLMETYMEDYKVVDGVKIPHVVKQVNPAMTIVIKITEVKNNVEIDDTKFNKPSGN
jgi:outer membrane lipoprotein-sorting protein